MDSAQLSTSIIIVLYNGQDYIQDCLAAVEGLGMPDLEVIVIDNSSSDNGAALVTEHFPTVRLVRNPENIGFAAACNQGAALAQGEVLAFLNQDTRVQPGWLKGLLAPLTQDPQIGLTTSKLLFMSQPDKINLCGLDVHYSGLSFGRGVLAPATGMEKAAPVSAVSGSAFAVRRPAWEKLGGFDTDYFMYYEDTDLSWRAWLAGYATWYAPASCALHDAPLKPAHHALAFSTRNRPVLLLKTWKVPTLVLLTPGLLLAELAEWALMAVYGKAGLRAKARAIGWLLKNRGAIRARRRHTQNTRAKPDWYLLRQCSPVFKPVMIKDGVLGETLVGLVNAVLCLNYWFALTICRIGGI